MTQRVDTTAGDTANNTFYYQLKNKGELRQRPSTILSNINKNRTWFFNSSNRKEKKDIGADEEEETKQDEETRDEGTLEKKDITTTGTSNEIDTDH